MTGNGSTNTEASTSAWNTASRIALALLCLALFIDVLDVSIVTVALPTIQNDLHFSATNLQWIINGYAITYGGFLMLGGRSGDILGRRNVLIGGMALFTLASLSSGLAQSEAMLITSRVIQGVGGAIIAPMTLALLTEQFEEGRARNLALAVWGSVGGAAGAAGVLFGGLLTSGPGWRWVFFVNLPIGLLIMALAPRFLKPGLPKGEPINFDFIGALTATAGVSAFIYGVVEAGDWGWGSGHTLIPIAVGLGLVAIFCYIEARLAKFPLVPLGVFRIESVASSNIVALVLGSAMFAMFFFLSLYYQRVLGWSSLRTGLSFLPLAIAIMVGGGIAPALADRIKAGTSLAIGLGMVTVGLLFYTQAAVDASALAVIGPAILVGLGLGFCFVPLTIASVAGVPYELAGVASALINATRQIGGAFGLALVSTLANNRTTDSLNGKIPTPAVLQQSLLDGYRLGFAVCAIMAVIGAVLAATLLRRAEAAAVSNKAEGVPTVAL